MSRVVLVDCETSGLIVTEPGGIIQFSARLLGENLVEVSEMHGLNDPGIPISPEITKLTGLTDADVAGHVLNPLEIELFLAQADIVIAHNAVFDRAWLRKHGVRDTFRWGCSLTQIDWTGMPCRHLQHLAFELGLLNEPMRHDAQNDTKILGWILSPTVDESEPTRLQELLDNAAAVWNLVLDYGSPFESKDLLKASGFHWGAPSKVWWTMAREDKMDLVKDVLKAAYGSARVTAKMKAGIDPLDPDLKERFNL